MKVSAFKVDIFVFLFKNYHSVVNESKIDKISNSSLQTIFIAIANFE